MGKDTGGKRDWELKTEFSEQLKNPKARSVKCQEVKVAMQKV